MNTVDMIVFGIIGISTLLGFMRGFDKQIQQLGKGIVGFIIVVVVIFMYSGFIFELPFVVAFYDWAQRSLADSAVSFLSNNFIFLLLKYVLLFVVMSIILRVILSLIGGLVGSSHGKASALNNAFGALLGLAMSVCIVMLLIAVINVLPETEDVMMEIQNSLCGIFYTYNPFLGLF